MVFYIAFISRERFIKSLKQSFVKALPYFSIVFVYGVLRLTVLNFDNTLNFYSKANLYTESFWSGCIPLNVLLTYAKLLILPLDSTWREVLSSIPISLIGRWQDRFDGGDCFRISSILL